MVLLIHELFIQFSSRDVVLHGVVEMLFTYLVCLPGSCNMPSEGGSRTAWNCSNYSDHRPLCSHVWHLTMA